MTRTWQEFIATAVASKVRIDDKAENSWLSILKNTGISWKANEQIKSPKQEVDDSSTTLPYTD